MLKEGLIFTAYLTLTILRLKNFSTHLYGSRCSCSFYSYILNKGIFLLLGAQVSILIYI